VSRPAVRLRRLEPVQEDGWATASAVIESPDRPRRRLWFSARLPEGWSMSQASDAFVPVPLHQAMRLGVPLDVEGQVSPSLLANLEEYQAVQSRWHPRRFKRVQVVAEHERERTPGADGALLAFSGGVDSCFTALRHARGEAGRQTTALRAGVMVRGFDIPLEDPETFDAAFAKAEAILGSLGVPLVRMATNARQVEHAWNDMMAAAIASCLAAVEAPARTGLIPGEFAYHLVPAWGVHPLTDPLLSSAAFRIVHDGAGFTRMQKVAALAGWPEALRLLRVCWAGAQLDRNCGRCSKCVRTVLAFRAAGLPVPPSFEREPTRRQILALAPLDRVEQRTQRALLDTIAEGDVRGPWVGPARALYYRSRRRALAGQLAGRVRRRLGR
jgi:hypothetical protein